MIVDLNSFLPLATILGAAAAPTIAAIWAESKRARDARRAADEAVEVRKTLVLTSEATNEKLHTIEHLVNDQLTQAVNRFESATKEIAELKVLITKLKAEGGGVTTPAA